MLKISTPKRSAYFVPISLTASAKVKYPPKGVLEWSILAIISVVG
jgi:hypothetical protein